MPARSGKYWPSLIVVGCALSFTAVYLQSTSKWWFEDDPLQYAYVAAIPNPVSIFVDPAVLRGFGTGSSVVPMQLLSYWLDVHLFGASPLEAYLHCLLSTTVTVLLLYLVLARFTHDSPASACLALLWLCLPSTIAVHYFLATRHYMEGFGWSLAACYWLYRLCDRPPHDRGVRDVALVLTCAAAALLSKELYVAFLPPVLVVYSLTRRRPFVALASLALLAAYAAYRAVTIGTTLTYPVPRLTGLEYARYLRILPYTFAANWGGYLYYGALLGGCLVLLIRRRPLVGRLILFLGALLIAALGATYPTAAAVLPTYQTPGTWYRAVFGVNTIALVSGGYLAVRYSSRSVQGVALSLLIGILVPGVIKTRSYWEGRFARAEQEGKFYLSNPDKLIYSEEDASWFLPGLERLYGVAASHYVSRNEVASAHTRTMLERFPTIWRYRDGRWSADAALYQRIDGESLN